MSEVGMKVIFQIRMIILLLIKKNNKNNPIVLDKVKNYQNKFAVIPKIIWELRDLNHNVRR